MLLGDIPSRNALFYPEKTAAIEGRTRYTFAQFNERVNRLANAICAMGLVEGDRMAVLNHNCFQYIELYFAAAKSGTPLVPLNFRFSPDELAYVMNDSGAKALFFGKDYAPSVEFLRKDAPAIKHFICINAQLSGAENYDEIIVGSHAGEPARRLDENDVAILCYTGGTTGKPKGVMTTHRNVITSCYNTVVERELSNRDVFLNALPVFHAGGANSMFAFAFLGATNIFMSTSGIDTILQTVEAHHVTDFVLVPTQIMSLLENPHIGKYDLSSVKTIYYGTAPISVEPLKKMMRLMKCRLSQTYGMTETFVPVSILKPEDHVLEGDPDAVLRVGSAGRAVMGVKVKIVDDSDQEVETGQVGEIIVSGSNVMKGYWNLPELTREVLKNGWLHTGDMGKMDKLGYLYVVDRKKEMIISGGENIYAKEVEDVLSSHPEVSHAAVIGVPDDKWGEAVKGLVIREKGSQVSEKELIDFCKNRLANYKKPRSIEFMEEFPKSTAGKVLKRELRQKYWQGREKKI